MEKMTYKEHLIKRPNFYLRDLDSNDFHYLYEVLEEESELTIYRISFSSLESYLMPKILLKKRDSNLDDLLEHITS